MQTNDREFFLGEARGRRIAQNVLSLPTLPTVVAKMIAMIDDPETSASRLSRLIASDQVLSAKILKLANSSYYGLSGRVSTLNFAIVILGFENLKNLTIGISVVDRFSENWQGVFDYTEFWEHAIGCGVAARMLAKELNPQKAGEAFVAGLIHDIGKLILSQYVGTHFKAVTKELRNRDLDFHTVEKRILGVSHADIGGWFAEKWNLPAELVAAVTYHHEPEKVRHRSLLASVVHFADYLVRRFGIGFQPGQNMPVLEQAILRDLPLQTTRNGEIDFFEYEERLRAEMEVADTFVNLLQREPV